MKRNAWVDVLIAALTLAAVLSQVLTHDANARAVAIKVKQHTEYYCKQAWRTFKQYHEPAWQTELRRWVDD